MAYQALATMRNHEVRFIQKRTMKSGKEARFIRVESPDASFNAEIQVWDSDLFPKVDALQKGDVADFVCRFSAGDYEGISLVDVQLDNGLDF